MCSIVGLQGNFKGNDIIKMLKASKNRGPDSSGVFLDEIHTDINLDDFSDDNDYSIAFGHNLLSIYDLDDRISKPQPTRNDNLVLVFNGEIYNFHTIRNLLKKVGVTAEITSDADALLYLIDSYNKGDLVNAIQLATRLVDGDYAFAVYDGENLALVRDPLGVKPLFYSKDGNNFGFASSALSLKEVGFSDINTLKPEHILFNGEDISPAQHLWEKIQDGDVAKIDKMLKLSVVKRVEGLTEVGVIFSGGIDSSYLALLLKEISENVPLKIKLYAVGVEGSKDVEAAIYASKFLNLDLEICEVNENMIRDALPSVVKAIGDDNLMKVGVGLTTYFATKLVAKDGIKVAISLLESPSASRGRISASLSVSSIDGLGTLLSDASLIPSASSSEGIVARNSTITSSAPSFCLRRRLARKRTRRSHRRRMMIKMQPAIIQKRCSSTDGLSGYDLDGVEHACRACPWNRMGSRDGGRGKACRNMVQLLIMVEGEPLPVELKVPPMSVNNYAQYVARVLSPRGLEPWQVATEFTLMKATNGTGIEYSQIMFKPAGRVKDEEIAPLMGAMDPMLNDTLAGALTEGESE